MDIEKKFGAQDYKGAVAVFEAGYEANDQEKYLVAASYLRLKKIHNAYALFLELIDKHPKNRHALLGLAVTCAKLEKYSEASENYRTLYKITNDEQYLFTSILFFVRSKDNVQIPWEKLKTIKIDETKYWNTVVEILSPVAGSQILSEFKRVSFPKTARLAIFSLLDKRKKYGALVKALSKELLESRQHEQLMDRVLHLLTQENPENSIRFLEHYCRNHSIQIQDLNISTQNNYANALYNLGYVKEALAIVEKYVEHTSDYAVLNNAALIYQKNKKPEQAEKLLLSLLEKYNRPYEAVANLANLYRHYVMYTKADALYSEVFRLNPEDIQSKLNFSTMLIDRGDLNEALEFLSDLSKNKSLKENERLTLQSNRLFALNYYENIDDKTLLLSYNANKEKNNIVSNIRRTTPKIKVGLLSADFKYHSAEQFMYGFLDLADYQDLDIYLISNVQNKDAKTYEYMEKWGSYFIDIAGLTTGAAHSKVKRLELDLVIDLSGRTSGNRFDILEKRIGRVQCSALGYNFSTGANCIDYLITQKGFFTPDEQSFLKEYTIEMRSPLPIKPREYSVKKVDEFESSRPPRLVCCSRASRINTRLMKCWSEISKRTEAIIEINSPSFRSSEAISHFLRKFEPDIGDLGFLDLSFESPIDLVYARADLTLDCFPHNSGTTLYESLLCGVPFVTKHDRVAVGRFGSLLAKSTGNPKWVTYSDEEYVERAIDMLKSNSKSPFEISSEAHTFLGNTQQWAEELRDKILSLFDE